MIQWPLYPTRSYSFSKWYPAHDRKQIICTKQFYLLVETARNSFYLLVYYLKTLQNKAIISVCRFLFCFCCYGVFVPWIV